MNNIDTKELTQSLVKYLNSIKDSDADALLNLCNSRVPCNQALFDHPTCLCGYMDETGKMTNNKNDTKCVGMLGIINGFLTHLQGIDENSTQEEFNKTHRIVFDFDNNKLNKIYMG